MSREKRGPDGVSARERAFATNLCKGMRPKEAYLAAGLGNRDNNSNKGSNAYEKARQPNIVAFMSQWLDRARISDIDSVGKAVQTTLSAINEATDDRNWTAIAALQRLRYQHNGIAEKTTVAIEMHMSDADLIRRIAGDDEGKVGLLNSLLRTKTFSAADDQLLIEGQAAEDDTPE